MRLRRLSGGIEEDESSVLGISFPKVDFISHPEILAVLFAGE
jgi:hypothetical protein